MKKNNKGFMMAELIIVSAIALSVLSVLFISFNKLYGIYMQRIRYYDSTTITRAALYRDILIENGQMNDFISNTKASNNKYTLIYETGDDNNIFAIPSAEKSTKYNDLVYLVNVNRGTISSNVIKDNINETFKEYLDFLNGSVEFDSNFIILIERCETSNDDNCKYAYLEVYDGSEG